jgi:DNA segregation ATPase FtsK/SpoIIIE, S-DNA-T family
MVRGPINGRQLGSGVEEARLMAQKKTKPKPGTRARRSPAHKPVVPQHQLELIGLGLVALGIFLGFLLYGGWQGGKAGEGLVDALALAIGDVRYLAPVAFLAAGAIVSLRPMLPAVRPFRSGGLCLLGACTLGLAAGTLGLGPGGSAVSWDATWLKPRGGALGEGLFWVTDTLLGSVGSHIVAVFLFLAAVLLLTGASLAGVLKATGSHVADTTRSLRTVRPPAVPLRGRTQRVVVPEPDDSEPRVARGARVEDLQERFADVFAEDDRTDELDDDAFVQPADRAEPQADGFFDPPEPKADPEPISEQLELDDDPAAEHVDEPVEDPELEPEPEEEVAPVLEVGPEDLTPQGRYRASVTESPDFVWRRPSTRLLPRSTADQIRPDTAGQEKTARALVEALGHFGVESKVVGTVAGPHITRYEVRLAPGVKMSKVANLKDDLAYALAATDIRILAPIPGKTAVGVEVPNARRKIVQLGDVMSEPPDDWSPLTVWLGKDVAGRAIGADLAKMPHLLVAGTTGAGKSACVNAMLSSILLNADPHEVRLVLVDPKQVELNHYEGIPHLLTPVITHPRVAANALQNLVKEMEDRYSIMSMAKTRSLPELNRRREERGDTALPYILCVIDELADLMMVAPADVEDSIIRLAQKARAVGIHLVLATQSPRVDVITGMIKANVPSRIAFAVSSQTDSRVILDQNGAESLLGKGDMLFSPVGSSKLQRIQGAYIDEPQIETITDFWRKQGEPELREDLLEEIEEEPAPAEAADPDFDPNEDPLLEDAIRLVAEMGTASTSMLQRRLRLGYTRAGRLIDMLERRNVISGYEGSKPRQVLVGPAEAERFIAALRDGSGESGDATAPHAVPVPDDE